MCINQKNDAYASLLIKEFFKGDNYMGWATYKINLYHQQTRQTNCLEQLMLKHNSLRHFIITVSALTSITYGLWIQDWCLILGSAGFHFSWP